MTLSVYIADGRSKMPFATLRQLIPVIRVPTIQQRDSTTQTTAATQTVTEPISFTLMFFSKFGATMLYHVPYRLLKASCTRENHHLWQATVSSWYLAGMFIAA